MTTVIRGSFEWDEDKNIRNQQKHGVAFEEAVGLFSGRNRYSRPYIHKTGETRQYVVGFLQEIEFTVVFTHRNNRIRIISVRRARKEERNELRQ